MGHTKKGNFPGETTTWERAEDGCEILDTPGKMLFDRYDIP